MRASFTSDSRPDRKEASVTIFPRAKALLFCFCAVACFSQPARAEVVALLKSPDVQTSREQVADGDNASSTPISSSASPSATTDISIPPLPEVEVSLPGTGSEEASAPATSEENLQAGIDTGIGIALPPEATVTFTAKDHLANALAARLADRGNGKGLQLSPRLSKQVRVAIAEFYEKNDFQPFWIDNGQWTTAAESLRKRLARADEDALDAADYTVPALASTDNKALAQAELTLSASALLYARDARGGRIDPSRLSKNITPELQLPEVHELFPALAKAADAGAVLESFNPQHAGYLALKKKLAEIRQSRPHHVQQDVPRGPALKIGMRDERVPLIRTRFGLGPVEKDEDTYDASVAAAVASFQKSNGLKASGVLNDQTVAALDGAPSSVPVMEGNIIANMERWRWLPSELGERYIQVNVPEYKLRIIEDGSITNQLRVIVGKAQSPTPIFSGVMQNVVVNPYWTIPPSILKNEVLPGMAKDPAYAQKRGYEVIRSRNGNLTVRQPPGERNALGRIKFLFPNQHAVYLHDTPNRNLFSVQKRAFSHGCVRVDEPFQFAEEVLGRANWPAQKMRNLIGKGERHIKLTDPVAVHMTYFTLSIGENGEIQRFDDIYGFNKRVREALGLK